MHENMREYVHEHVFEYVGAMAVGWQLAQN
jgi:hypothetical protein